MCILLSVYTLKNKIKGYTMKYKYIGKFDIESIIINGEEVIALIPEGEELIDNDTYSNWYNVYDFMKAPHGSIFGAIYGVSNTTAIGMQLNILDNNAKLWVIS